MLSIFRVQVCAEQRCGCLQLSRTPCIPVHFCVALAAGFVAFVCFASPRRLCSGSHTASNERTGTGLRLYPSLCVLAGLPVLDTESCMQVVMLSQQTACWVCVHQAFTCCDALVCVTPVGLLQAFDADCSPIQRACRPSFNRHVMPKHALLCDNCHRCVSWPQPDLRWL